MPALSSLLSNQKLSTNQVLLIAIPVLILSITIASHAFTPIIFTFIGALIAWLYLFKFQQLATVSHDLPHRSHRHLSSVADNLNGSNLSSTNNIQPTPLVLGNGSLNNVVRTLFRFIVRDFVETWYSKYFIITICDPPTNSSTTQHTFPSEVTLSLNAFAMNLKAQITQLGASDIIVELATRFCDDLVNHLKLCPTNLLPALSLDHDYSEHHSMIEKYVQEHPSSNLAACIDSKFQNIRLLHVSRRLISGFLATRDAKHPILSSLVQDIVGASVLTPVVNLLASPKFLNQNIVNALITSTPATHSPVQNTVLKLHVIQTRSHSSFFVDSQNINQDDLFLSVEYLGHSHQISIHSTNASLEPPTTPTSFVFDSFCSFPLEPRQKKPKGSLMFRLCHKNTEEPDKLTVLGTGKCDVSILPHIEWVTILEPNESTQISNHNQVVMEIFIEVGLAVSKNSPPTSLSVSRDDNDVPQNHVSQSIDSAVATTVSTISESGYTSPGLDSQGTESGFEMYQQPRTPSPSPPLTLSIQEWETLTLETILNKPKIRSDFTVFLDHSLANGSTILDLFSALNEYVEKTNQLDLSDPHSKALMQQHAYQIFEQYLAMPPSRATSSNATPISELLEPFGRNAELVPKKMVTELEECIVLDPSPTLFSEVIDYLQILVLPYIQQFAKERAANARREMSVSELVNSLSTSSFSLRKIRPRSKSVSFYDRQPQPREVEPIDALKEKYTHLVQGKYIADMAFTTSCINTLSWQLMVLNRLHEHSLMQGIEDKINRLQSQKTNIECMILALEPLLVSPDTTLSKSLMASLSSPSKIESAFEVARKRFDFKAAMLKGAQTMNKGSLNVSSKFRQSLSSFSTKVALPATQYRVPNISVPAYLDQNSSTTRGQRSASDSVTLSRTKSPAYRTKPQPVPKSQSLHFTTQSSLDTQCAGDLSGSTIVIEPPAIITSESIGILSTTQAEVLMTAAFSVVKQVFALHGTLRARIFDAISQMLRPTLASHIQQRFIPLIGKLCDPRTIANIIQKGILDTLWPNGQWRSSSKSSASSMSLDETELRLLAAQAHQALETALPDHLARALGKSNALTGIASTFTVLQIEQLNRSLIISLLESVVECLVPESF